MKNRSSTSKRKRIILYYSLGLILPGLVLGLLAVRGLKNDQALREKGNRQELQLFAADVFAGFDRKVDSIKDHLQNNPTGEENLVYIGWRKVPGEATKIIRGQMIFWPDGTLPAIYDHAPNPEIAGIQKEEYTRRDPSSVIRRYNEILTRSTNPEIQTQALLGMGRLYKKSGQQNQAVSAYQSLAQDHLDEQLPARLPVGAIALTELIRLHRATGDTASSQAASEQLVRFFISPPLRFEKMQFDYLYDTWKSLNCPVSLELTSQLESTIDQTNYLVSMHNLSNGLFTTGVGKGRYIKSDVYPGWFIQVTGMDGEQSGWVLNLNIFMEELFPSVISEKDPSQSIKWAVATDAAGKVYGSMDLDHSFEIQFPAGYPPWTLRLAKTGVQGWQALFQTSQGVLMLVFVFIILLMIAGLVFMLHTLNQEMKLNKMKSNFISNVSHEFKTPLTSIRHMTEIMHLKRIDSEERKDEYLQSMLEQCDHLGHLIENILDFSRIEEDVKNYRFEEHRLDEILRDLVPVFQGRIPEEDFRIELRIKETPPTRLVDKDAIQQVFYNLMDNAYKYSGGAKKIEISCSLNEMDKEVSVSVRDWGPGIPEKEQGRIFERFYRGDRLRTEGIKGSGIGLTIVKRIVEAHGGRVELESNVGEGTSFTVILPVIMK